MKVLVIRFSSIGDIVLTTPVVRCLKLQQPATSIHYLTKASYKAVLSANPYIDKFHFLTDDLSVVIEQLKEEKFDYIIDLHNNLRTLRVKKALKTPTHTFQKLNLQKWLLVNLKVNLMPDKSIVDRYFETLQPLDIRNDGQGLDHFIPDGVTVTNDDIPMSHWNGYVGCVIGGSYNTKKLPVSQWQQFCKEVPFPVMLLGGPEDREEGVQIAAQDTIKIYNACGKFSLNESALLVKNARIIVSNDTGLMHIAAAYRKKVVSLWGNTSPDMGMFPYYGFNNLKSRLAPQSFIVENKDLKCHPCSKLGYDRCPKKHFRCMNDLNMSEVASIVKNNWNIPNAV